MTNRARPARSLKLTPGASSPAPYRPDLISPAKGDRALRRTSDTHAFSFGVEEDWRGDDAFDIATAQEIDGTNELTETLAPLGEKAKADVLIEHRREGDRGEIALVIGRDGIGADRNEMRAGGQGLRSIDGFHADEDRSHRVDQSRAPGKHLADAILVCRDHAAEAKVARRGLPVDLWSADMPLLDAKHVQRLCPIRCDVEVGPSLHQRTDRRVAVARRHGDLVGKLAGEGHAEQPRRHPTADRELARGHAWKAFVANIELPIDELGQHLARTRTGDGVLRPVIRHRYEPHIELWPQHLTAELEMLHHLAGIGGGRGHDEMLLAEARRGAVIHGEAVLTQHQAIAGAANFERREFIGIDAVEQRRCIWTLDVDLAQRRDIAHANRKPHR